MSALRAPGALAALTALALLASCEHERHTDLGPIAPCTDLELPPTHAGEDVVWGFADLHTHPGIEAGFRGAHLVWGGAHADGHVDPSELPAIAPCPVETHASRATGPLDRSAHTLILPLLNAQARYPHGPVASSNGARETDAWPNARDVLHQQLPVAAIRRAFEGGLRVLLASVTDSQVISSLLAGPHFAEGFHADADAELPLARAQLDDIVLLARENRDWMEIARTPEDARRIIGEGRLALVLSLEMDGLRIEELESLIAEYGIGHVIAVHLIDNHLGGTAAFSDVMNAATAQVSTIFGRELFSYIRVEHDDRYTARLSRPIRIASYDPPLLFSPEDVPYRWYRALDYENLCGCERGLATTTRATGHANALGLTPAGIEALDRLMSLGVLLDVSHMSYRATETALERADIFYDYPLIASHGGVAPARGTAESERDLAREHARRVRELGGVVGLGTGGAYRTSAMLVGRGAPLFTVRRDGDASGAACVVAREVRALEPGCAPSLEPPSIGARAGQRLRSVELELTGGSPRATDAVRFAWVELRDPRGLSVGTVLSAPLDCDGAGCRARFEIPTSIPEPDASGALSCDEDREIPSVFRVRDLSRVRVGWLRTVAGGGERACGLGSDERWTIDGAQVTANGGAFSLAALRHAVDPLPATLGARGDLTLYASDDAPDAANAEGTVTDLVRVSIRAAPDAVSLPGAGVARYGTEVCYALRYFRGAPGAGDRACEPAPPRDPGSTSCGPGWRSINHRGVWTAGTRLDDFAHVATGRRGIDVCGVDVVVLDWTEGAGAWAIDEVRVDSITDPLAHWIEDYDEVLRDVFGDEAGRIAFGSDMNGFAVQMPITSHHSESARFEAWGCSSEARATLRVAGREGTVRLDERGLASFGLLHDLTASIADYPVGRQGVTCEQRSAVVHSLMLSAEATLRTWERARAIAAQRTEVLPRRLPAVVRACGGTP